MQKLSLIPLLSLSLTLCNAQSIEGFFALSPPLTYADIHVNFVIDGEIVEVARAQTKMPFKFSKPMREEWKGKKIFFDPIVNKPDLQYVVDKSKCILNWTGSPARIILKRKTDIYASTLKQAIEQREAKQYAAAEKSFEFILQSKELLDLNDSQIYETAMGMSGVAIDQRIFTKQQQYMDSLGNWVRLSDLPISKFNRYSKERFNGFLKLHNYNALNYPSLDLARIITANQQAFDDWSAFLSTAGASYLPADLKVAQKDLEIVKKQVEALAVKLNQ